MQDELINQLTRDEGLRLAPYRDTVGKLTIGVGRNLDDVGISEEEARYLLENDLRQAMRDVLKHMPWASHLDPIRYGVLVNMAFNLGISGLLQFGRMLAALRSRDYDEAAREMINSMWAVQVGDRAVRLARQMQIGEWQ